MPKFAVSPGYPHLEFTMLKAGSLSRCLLLALCFGLAGSLTAQTVVGSISGVYTGGMAVNPLTNKLYVGGLFGVIDGSTNVFTQFNDTNAFAPDLVAVDPISNLIFVSDYGNGGTLGGYTLVNGANHTFKNAGVSDGTFSVIVNPVTDLAYFSTNLNGYILVVNKNGYAVKFIQSSNAGFGHVALNPLTNKIYATLQGFTVYSGMLVIDGSTNDYVEIRDPQVCFPTAIAVNPATNLVYEAFASENACSLTGIMVLDGATNGEKIISDPNAQNPVGITVNPVTNKIYVANSGDIENGNYGNITVIDGATNAVTTLTDPNAVHPAAIAFNPSTNQIFVANSQSNNVTVIDGATNAIKTLDDPTAVSPSSVAIDPVTNRVYVGNSFSQTITVIDCDTDNLANVADPTAYIPLQADVDPIHNKTYVADRGQGAVIDGTTDTLTALPVKRGQVAAVAVNPFTNRIYAGTTYNSGITVIDAVTNKTLEITDSTYFFGDVKVNPVTDKIYASDGEGSGIMVIDGATNNTTYVNNTAASRAQAIGINSVTNTIYVANQYSNNVTVLDGATNQFTTVADPNAKAPYAIAVNSVTNQIYVANSGSTNVTVIDGASNQVSTINTPDFYPAWVAVNSVTNEIYVTGGNGTALVINGVTQAITTINTPNAIGSGSPVVDLATNKVFVPSPGSDDITVIDGVTKGATTVQDRSAIGPYYAALNPVTRTVYVPNGGNLASGQSVTVLSELPPSSVPLQVKIQPLAKNETTNPTPTFNLTATDSFSPNKTVIDGVWFQMDTWQGTWQGATSEGSGKYTAAITTPLSLGVHVLYAYATDSQEATDTNPGLGTSPLGGKIAAYAFLVY